MVFIWLQADGIPQYRHTSILFDLSQGAYLMKYMDTNITETPVVPYRMERLYVYGSNRAKVSVTGKLNLLMFWQCCILWLVKFTCF